MTKKTLITTLAAALTLSLFTGVMTGCGSRSAQGNVNLPQEAVQEQAEGGVISVKVNPEIAVSYDEQGLVTKIEGRNDDGKKLFHFGVPRIKFLRISLSEKLMPFSARRTEKGARSFFSENKKHGISVWDEYTVLPPKFTAQKSAASF